jgi:hypothetical protein
MNLQETDTNDRITLLVTKNWPTQQSVKSKSIYNYGSLRSHKPQGYGWTTLGLESGFMDPARQGNPIFYRDKIL